MSNEELEKEIVDTVYDCYKLENDMVHTRYIHPMFYNGSFSKDYPLPPKPEPLMGKEEFIKMMNTTDSKWNTALEVLAIYIMRQNKDEDTNNRG